MATVPEGATGALMAERRAEQRAERRARAAAEGTEEVDCQEEEARATTGLVRAAEPGRPAAVMVLEAMPEVEARMVGGRARTVELRDIHTRLHFER